jgi:hypothetical protein
MAIAIQSECRKRELHTFQIISSSYWKGSAAMKKAHVQQRPGTMAPVLAFPHAEERASLERSIEARLGDLKEFVDEYTDAASNLLLIEKIPVREAVEELIVKVSALEWIVHVAKRFAGGMRERLWADIDKALSDLERTAESVVIFGERWGRICLGRF